MSPLIFETTVTDQGRTIYFTNDITTLESHDTNFNGMFTILTKDLGLTSTEVSSVQSTETSIGTTYTLIITKNNEQTQVNVMYNENTNTIKVTDIETVA